jgi:predicted PurR-regulated permease PerM
VENKNISNSIVNAVLKLSLIAFGVFIFLKLNIVLIYFIVAAVISLIGRPIVIFLEEKLKFRKLFAALFTLLFLVSLIFGLISLIIQEI